MDIFKLKLQLAVVLAVFLFICQAAFAGSDYETCIRQQSRLKEDEVQKCDGWSYILNPSACFNARKALSPYMSGRCRELARKEVVADVAEAPAARPSDSTVVAPSRSESVADVSKGEPGIAGEKATAAADCQTELARLRGEVTALRAELEILKGEVARQRGGR